MCLPQNKTHIVQGITQDLKFRIQCSHCYCIVIVYLWVCSPLNTELLRRDGVHFLFFSASKSGWCVVNTEHVLGEWIEEWMNDSIIPHQLVACRHHVCFVWRPHYGRHIVDTVQSSFTPQSRLNLNGIIHRSVNCGPWAKSSQPPIFRNKVLLEHSHTCSFTYCLWQFLQYNVRVK